MKTIKMDEQKERWWFPTPIEKITPSQLKEIMAAVLAMMVQATFETQIYEVEGQIYKQT